MNIEQIVENIHLEMSERMETNNQVKPNALEISAVKTIITAKMLSTAW